MAEDPLRRLEHAIAVLKGLMSGGSLSESSRIPLEKLLASLIADLENAKAKRRPN